MIENRLAQIEKVILGEGSWATKSMTFRQRLRFYRDTGEWPGVHSKEATRLFMQSNINAERADGKGYCAARKLQRAREAGLTIK